MIRLPKMPTTRAGRFCPKDQPRTQYVTYCKSTLDAYYLIRYKGTRIYHPRERFGGPLRISKPQPTTDVEKLRTSKSDNHSHRLSYRTNIIVKRTRVSKTSDGAKKEKKKKETHHCNNNRPTAIYIYMYQV